MTTTPTTHYCHAEWHNTPCPQPCTACAADCDPADIRPLDPWAEDADYPVADWQHEVANGYTRSGYVDWVANLRSIDKEVLEWVADGRACKRCHDLELIEPDEGVANGPLVDGLCTNCREDGHA